MQEIEYKQSLHKKSAMDDEISLRDIILNFQIWLRYLSRKWKIICGTFLLGAVFGLSYSIFTPVKYKATLTFVLNGNNSNNLSSYAGIASQLGVNLNGSNGDVFQSDNIIQFLQSKVMVEKALMTVGNFNGKNETLAENFLNWSGWREKWDKKPKLKNIEFPVGLSPDSFTLYQNLAMRLIYNDIINDKLNISKPDQTVGFIQVVCSSKSELFSKNFVERLVMQAIDFYINTKTKQAKESVNNLQEKADSVLALLNKKMVTAARIQDKNLNSVRNIAGVPAEMASRDESILMTTYAEIIKNLDIAKIYLAHETPIIQIIDTPTLPLPKAKMSKLAGILIGGFVFGVLIILVLLLKYIYSDIMTK